MLRSSEKWWISFKIHKLSSLPLMGVGVGKLFPQKMFPLEPFIICLAYF